LSPVGLLVVYCLLILLASLLGGWVPLLVRLTHRRMELLVSFVAGVMLGVAVLHLLPHAWMQRAEWLRGSGAEPAIGHELIGPVVWWLLLGFLAMFFVERFFCFHHHDVAGPADPAGPPPAHARHGHELTWAGAAIGLCLHSLMAGVALAASVEIGEGSSTGGAIVWTTGFSTFLAIFLHKPFDSMTIGALMAVGRRSTRARHLVNVAFGLVVPAGAGLFFERSAAGAPVPPARPPEAVGGAAAGAGPGLGHGPGRGSPPRRRPGRGGAGRPRRGWGGPGPSPQSLTLIGRWVSSSHDDTTSGLHRDRHYPALLRAGRDRCQKLDVTYRPRPRRGRCRSDRMVSADNQKVAGVTRPPRGPRING